MLAAVSSTSYLLVGAALFAIGAGGLIARRIDMRPPRPLRLDGENLLFTQRLNSRGFFFPIMKLGRRCDNLT